MCHYDTKHLFLEFSRCESCCRLNTGGGIRPDGVVEPDPPEDAVVVVPRWFLVVETRGSGVSRKQGLNYFTLRWQAHLVTEIVALAAIAPVPVVAFKKLQ